LPAIIIYISSSHGRGLSSIAYSLGNDNRNYRSILHVLICKVSFHIQFNVVAFSTRYLT